MLYAVGIEGVGYVTGRSLAAQFRTLDALLAATPEQIAGLRPAWGRSSPSSSTASSRIRRCGALLEDLRGLGLRLEREGPPPGEGPLRETTFVLTGTLPDLTREQATERILAQGGKVTGSVSAQERAPVVAGASPGAAGLEKAERLGVPVIDEPAAARAARARRAGAARHRCRVSVRWLPAASVAVIDSRSRRACSRRAFAAGKRMRSVRGARQGGSSGGACVPAGAAPRGAARRAR